MISKYGWLLLFCATICFLYSQYYFNETYISKIFEGLSFINVLDSGASGNHEKSINPLLEDEIGDQRVFTAKELQKYTNEKNGLYISILGQVFDVTKGAKHYGLEGTYHAFTGRDASLAFITGEFDEKGLTDDTSTLSVQQIKALNDWVQFYKKNYVYKGRLNGRYYDEDGRPTNECNEVKNIIQRAEKEKFEEEQRKKMLPPCNIEWNADSGTVVWCTDKSGGIERDWIGVPRMLFQNPSSKEYRCACVNVHSKEYQETKGMLREYTGCPKTSTKCAIKIDN